MAGEERIFLTEKLPHVVLIMTDQQRFDTIQALGANHMITPNLDRLVREGVSFTNVFVTSPSCVPSRASFFNGKFPSRMEVYHNFSGWEHSWVELLQQAGYHTINIGKMHTIPFDAPCGFDQRFVVENKDRPLRLSQAPQPVAGYYDEWNKFLNNSDVRQPTRFTYEAEYPGFDHALGAFEWPLEEKYHPDVFVGSMACWYLKQRESAKPLFMQIGFPGPHPPFDPPQRLIDLYAGRDSPPPPTVTEEEKQQLTPTYKAYRQMTIKQNHDAVKWKEDPSAAELSRLRTYYDANVTLIDEQIGRIIDQLEAKGYLDQTIIIFLSDHGEALGEHGLIQKWSMYDCVTKVPMILWCPGRFPENERRSQLIQHIDIPAALLEMLGIRIPSDWETVSLGPDLHNGREYVFSENAKNGMNRDISLMTMVRNHEYKLVHYLDQPFGELYDLQADPEEKSNLWNRAGYEQIQSKLLNRILDWRSQQMVGSNMIFGKK
jgi:arylsulfatase A-like enzyme